MSTLDEQYRIWAEDKSEVNLNLLLQRITTYFRGDVEEGGYIGQEVCFKVWENISKFAPNKETSFKAWVNTLARLERKTLLLYRRRELSRREFLADDPEDTEDGLTATEKLENLVHLQTSGVYDSTSRDEGYRGAKAESLLFHDDPFIRQYAEGVLDEKTDKQIAAEMDMKYGTLQKRLHDLRKKVRI